MKKREVMKEKMFINEYGVKTIYKLEKSFYDINGKEIIDEYFVVRDDIDESGRCFGGYFRSYKRLTNAMKDSYVEKYLSEEN